MLVVRGEGGREQGVRNPAREKRMTDNWAAAASC